MARPNTMTMPLPPLVPLQPPGRGTRKARQYAAQICQLRAQGYTLEAIQQALSAVGIDVSISTVRREALRPHAVSLVADDAEVDVQRTAAIPSPSGGDVSPAAIASRPAPVTGKDLAEAYARGRNNNPLVRAKEHSS